jgi:2-amino-4-hydroxy-6-hydroxymethyldihydropteridine diphosphokinase
MPEGRAEPLLPRDGSGGRENGPSTSGVESVALIALGSNLEPERNLPAALWLLADRLPGLVVSSAWATPPVGPPGQPPFVNAAVLVRTALPPRRLKLEILRRVERELGRRRNADRYAPRPIDLDLIAYGETTRRLAGRELPDPDLLRHAHVAVPASEIAPDWVHPRSRETLATIANRLVAALPPELRPRRTSLRLLRG